MECLLWIGRPRKPPVINNHIIFRRNAFIGNFCLVAMVTPLCPVPFTKVSQMNSLIYIAEILPQNHLCTDVLHTTEVMAIFVTLLPILAKIWLSWQRPLYLAIRNVFLWIGWPRPVISNHIIVISRRNAFVMYGSTYRWIHWVNSSVILPYILIAETLSQNKTLHWYVAYNWCYGYFCDICGRNLVASLTSLQSEMSSLEWLTTKIPCFK